MIIKRLNLSFEYGEGNTLVNPLKTDDCDNVHTIFLMITN